MKNTVTAPILNSGAGAPINRWDHQARLTSATRTRPSAPTVQNVSIIQNGVMANESQS